MKKSIHILLVEDDPDDVELLATAFRDKGTPHNFTVISQAEKILPFLDACDKLPDVMLLDLNLPRAHGKDILAAIKNSEAHQQLPVIILTTSAAQSDLDFCLQAGAAHFFTKPNRLAEFDEIINTIIATANN